jgi:hypothetical protein
VTDQGSLSVISPAPFGCGETITEPVVVPLPSDLPGVRSFPDSTAIPTTTCVAPSLAPLSLFPPQGALCDRRPPSRKIRFLVTANMVRKVEIAAIAQVANGL